MPLDLHQQVGETHTVIPDNHPLPAFPAQNWIQENNGSVDIEVNDPFHHSNLGRGNGPSRMGTSLEIHQCIVEILDQPLEIGNIMYLNRMADLVKLWVTQ